jgi:hypothetical protein
MTEKSESTDAENPRRTHGFSSTCQAFRVKRSTDGMNRRILPRYITAAVSLMMLSNSAYSGPGDKLSNSCKLSDTNEGSCSPVALRLGEEAVA